MPGDWRTWNAMSLMGGAIALQGRHEVADPLLRDGYEKMDPPSGSATRKREALERLIAHYEAWGRPEDAARWRKATGPTPDQAR